MNTLVLYDNTGMVIATMTGNYPDLVGTAVIEVPSGYEISRVNTETGEVILTPKPATEAERMAAIEKQQMQEAVAHAGTYEDPVPFVYGMPTEYQKYYIYAGTVYQWNDSYCTSCVWLPGGAAWQWVKAVDPSAAGSKDDPIIAARSMEYEYGKYYFDPEDSKTYLCTRNGTVDGEVIILHFLPHELVGQYFELA